MLIILQNGNLGVTTEVTCSKSLISIKYLDRPLDARWRNIPDTKQKGSAHLVSFHVFLQKEFKMKRKR